MYYMLETDNHCLTRFCYVKSNNCFELYESMERIKALLKLSETLDHIKPTREKSEYLIPNLSQMNQVLKHELSIFISTMLIEIARNLSKIQFMFDALSDFDILLVEPLTFLYFVPCPRMGEHSIRVLLCLSWGERKVYDVKNHGELLK